jgi:hypothetical protein
VPYVSAYIGCPPPGQRTRIGSVGYFPGQRLHCVAHGVARPLGLTAEGTELCVLGGCGG